jgi:uncharacterized membrane protein
MTHEQLLQFGMLVAFIGFVIIISSFFLAAKDKSDVKFSVFGVFGFVPFGFANDKRLFIATMIMSLILIVAVTIFFSKYFKPMS